ncbi:hypothetical protein [Salinicola avicenniae]|uniref:hypothetical protein n=1 Tax=Salinicola avicenniae TaxID=2916836 RepID=UPI002074A6BD|nr:MULTISPECIES: hypothetical protein [unclassified Salinicola]
MSQSRSSRLGAIVLLVASLVGLALALYAYLTPLTGVTDSLGALVVILASILLAVLALILRAASGRGARIALSILILVGLLGTGFAGLLLHQWWFTAAMALGLVGLIIDATTRGTASTAHS